VWDGRPCATHSRTRTLAQTESWLLAKLQLKRLDDLLYARAELVIRRLGELARERAQAQT
jgi:hypothetical protein